MAVSEEKYTLMALTKVIVLMVLWSCLDQNWFNGNGFSQIYQGFYWMVQWPYICNGDFLVIN